MSETLLRSRRRLLQQIALLGLLPSTGSLTHAFSALDRKATQVRMPKRSFLQCAAMAGSERIVAVGERGIVLLSDDQGRSWRQADSVPISVTLTAVCFVDASFGWAVGHGGVILHTNDGGNSWIVQADGRRLAQWAEASAIQALQHAPEDPRVQRELKAAQQLVADGPDKPLLDVYFLDRQRGWAVGAYNLMFETTNGGRSWNSAMLRMDNPRAMHLYAIRVSGNDVFVAGEQGLLQRSEDGGKSFRSLTSPYKGTWFSMAVEPQGIVIAGLRGNAFFSGDKGESWSAIAGAPPVSFVASTLLRNGSVLLANQAGQLWTTSGGQRLQLIEAPPMPMVSGLLDLGAAGWIVTGANGVMQLPLKASKKTNP